MRARQKVSRAGVELIKSFEGLRSTAARLPDGRWTLGYGHTFSAREGARVTQEDADALLRFDLLPIVDTLNNMVLVPLNQNQFDALVSFCFNIGVENFGASTVLKRINEGRMTEAALAMDAWRSAEFNGQTYVLAPLIRRRAAEKNLFLTPEETAGNAPTLLVRPVEDAPGAAPTRPSELDSPDRGGILSAYPVGAAEPSRPEPAPEPTPAPNPAQYYSPYSQPAPATFAQPAPAPVMSPYTAPVEPAAVAVTPERIVEALPEGMVFSSAMRETPAEPAPLAFAAPYPGQERVSDEPAPQMSAEVQAALARAQEEQRQRDEALRQSQALAAAEEARQRENARLLEEARLQEQQRLAAAEQARLELQRVEQARLEVERLAAEDAERQRLAAIEAANLEQARLEQARLEQARLEQARMEQARLDQVRLEQARLEQARLEQEQLAAAEAERQRLAAEEARRATERDEQARIEREREAAAAAERERLAAAEAERQRAELARAATPETPPPGGDEAEKIRKAEAAAALMRLYSPYGGGSLGKPLAAPLTAPAAKPVAPAPVEEFSNHSVIAPSAAHSSPIDISSHAEPVRPVVQSQPEPAPAPVPEEEDEDDGPIMAPFGVSASAMPAPVITAINPYAQPLSQPAPKPVATPMPDVVEVPRPVAVDLSAPSTAAIFERQPAPTPPELNWREQLQRPLPEGYKAPESSPPEQTSLLQASRASRYDQVYDDDNEPWTMDGDRIALSSEEMHEENANWGKMIVSTLWWIFISGMGLACLGVATASWLKTKDPAVLRNGFAPDYTTLSIVMATIGIFFVSVSVWLIMKRLGGLKDES